MIALAILIAVLALIALRVNLVWALMAGALMVQFTYGAGELSYFSQDIWAAMDRQVLLAIPLFVLVGQIMSRGSIAARLIRVIVALTGHLPGGLAMATILSCAAFSAISGSSIITMLAVGSVLYPALTDNGYSRRFAIGALCAGGTLGIVIPPSVPMILYGIMTETSIVSLFRAGIGPGILLTVAFTLYAVIANWNRPRLAFSGAELVTALKQGALAILMPVILLGGIYSGHFSPTEAAAVAIGYALLVEVLIYREMKIADYIGTVSQSGILVGTLFPLLAVAMSINKLLAEKQVPGHLVDMALHNVESPMAFILIVNGLLLLVGAVMDTGSAIVITAPVLSHIAEAYGYSPIQLGIIMILNLEIGILTPPMGMNLIVAMTAFHERFGLIVRSVIPWIVVMLLCLLLVTLVPWIALALV
ncbi:MAG: TRAP transporter large permease [Rhodobacter sp.]|uniref:TRAP transporter large permease n=1 Tax=Pararhodobacter sp. TaxID=2127056 RepID=UPI001E032F33|nr:TRAP transporter large permease [Pararhodobacter sp.]MCB1345078.1 TRAP transporter large permease [Paracoccaceae bacterium]MCC0072685.1 TRAP transporter large permease [Rhodobacter sp.]HPD92441.1 TRAP transporter large permease [Pararhodobacter sp.]